MKKVASSYHIGVSAEAFVAAQFARYGYDVSVQYGANQPEYDLIAHKDDLILKISVKGSQDGGWGLTQGYKKDRSYSEAIDKWLESHGKKTVFCLVQFKNVSDDEMPRMYLATPAEIAVQMKSARGGNGDTVLREKYTYTRGIASGSTDRIPEKWTFTAERADQIFKENAG